jgi:hypothetical protein
LKFIADALCVYTENGEVFAEAVPRPKNGWDEAVTGTCRVALSSDDPHNPLPIQADCTGAPSIASSEADGKTTYWCVCGT